MARARNVKPGFFKNETLAELDPVTRLLFIGLWTISDREGRLEDRPKRIKGELFPYDSFDINEHLDDLAKHGFILRYEVSGSKYIQVVNFKKHQNPHVKESSSTIPAPCFNHTSRSDSPFSDSLLPSKPLSGLPPDGAQSSAKKPNGLVGKAIEILDFLNEKTGRSFRGLQEDGKPSANLEFIIARLKTGVTVEQCRMVIARQHREWFDNDEMKKFLRPETLFNKRKFESYLGSCTTEKMPEPT